MKLLPNHGIWMMMSDNNKNPIERCICWQLVCTSTATFNQCFGAHLASALLVLAKLRAPCPQWSRDPV